MKTVLALCALLLSSCIGSGYDLQRYENDLADYKFARALASRWIEGDPPTPADVVNVNAALDAWRSRLDSDARVLGVGAK